MLEEYVEILRGLRDKRLEEVVNILLNCMEETFKKFNFPYNCCDFATQFGGIVLNDLGYKVEVYQTFNYSHNYLMVDNKILDFTIHQYENILPGIIEDKYKDIYVNNIVNYEYTNFIKNVSYDDIKKNNLNFMNYVLLMAIDNLK